MSNRYKKNEKIINNSFLYKDILDKKNITQYATFRFNELKNIESYNLDYVLHKYQPNDKLFMISQKYYNSPDYGWLICYANKISNELEIKIGTDLKIYLPLSSLLELL